MRCRRLRAIEAKVSAFKALLDESVLALAPVKGKKDKGLLGGGKGYKLIEGKPCGKVVKSVVGRRGVGEAVPNVR